MVNRQDKPYDNGSKRLLTQFAQDFMDWLAPGAIYTGKRSEVFQSVAIDADAMHEALRSDQLEVMHVEIQSGPDPDMEQRLLEYNIIAFRRYQCFVDSYVIFLRDGGGDLQPPLVRRRADGRDGLTFDYTVILMREVPCNVLLTQAPRGVWALIPFSKGGAQREVIEEVIQRLTPITDSDTKELVSLFCFFAELAFPDDEDKMWIRRRKAMLDDFLRQSTIYQDILAEGRAEGEEKGRAEGEEKGRVEGRIETLFALFDERFPRLKRVVQKLLPSIKKPEILQRLTIEIAVAKDEKEARDRLMEASLQDE